MESLSNQVISEFKDVVADAEALLKATASQGDSKIVELRAQAEESLKVVKARLAEAQHEIVVRSREAAKATDVYVHENPWKAVGIAAGVGLVVGLLIARR